MKHEEPLGIRDVASDVIVGNLCLGSLEKSLVRRDFHELTLWEEKPKDVLQDTLLELMANEDGKESVHEECFLVHSGSIESPRPRQTVWLAANASHEHVQIVTGQYRAMMEGMVRTRPCTMLCQGSTIYEVMIAFETLAPSELESCLLGITRKEYLRHDVGHILKEVFGLGATCKASHDGRKRLWA